MPVIERVLTVTETNKICIDVIGKEAGQGRIWWGCAQTKYQDGKLVCIIHRIDDLRVRSHERGHCNGWSNNHETQAELKTKESIKKPVFEYVYSGPKAPISHPTIDQQLLPWPVK